MFFLTYREWHVAFMVTSSILFFFLNFNFLRHFLMCVLIFPPSGEETYHQYLWLGYDTIRAYHFTCLFFSLFLSSSISLDELPIAIARLPPTNLVFIHIFTSFTGFAQ